MPYNKIVEDLKLLKESFDANDLISYQLLLIKAHSITLYFEENNIKDSTEKDEMITAFASLLNDCGLSHLITIQDLNELFEPSNGNVDISNTGIYITLLNIILQEWESSTENVFSFRMKEIIENILKEINETFKDENIQEVSTDYLNKSSQNNEQENNYTPCFYESRNKEYNNLTVKGADDFKNQIKAADNDEFKNNFMKNLSDLNTIKNSNVNSSNSESEVSTPMATSPYCKTKTESFNLNDSIENTYPEFNNFEIKNKNYLKEYIMRKKLIPYQCECCGLSSWQNNPLMLYLYSKNGVYSSSNLNNLVFLCPNCYSQLGE